MADDKEKKAKYEILEKSPMFQLSLASKELFHSNLLAWIASFPDRASIDHPFRKLMKSLGADKEKVDKWPSTWHVAREYHNFDLCVLDKIPDDYEEDDCRQERPDNEKGGKMKSRVNVLLVLENKVKSIPYITQLHEYQDKIIEYNFEILKDKDPETDPKKKLCYKWQISSKGVDDHIKKDIRSGNPNPGYSYPENIKRAREIMRDHVDHVLLTMSTEFPDKKTIEEERTWHVSSYDNYVDSLRGIASCINKGSKESVVLGDYIEQLDVLTQLHSEWCLEKDTEAFQAKPFLDVGDPKLKELRIHDLFHKQRYAKICALLRGRLKEVFNEYEIELKDQMIIQNGEAECHKKAIVSFGYLHGEPLLDIWLGYKNYVYTIQVQGEAYEHGIQKMVHTSEERNSVALWNEIWNGGGNGQAISEKEGWNWICNFNKPFDEDGNIIIKDGSLNYFPIIEASIFDGESPSPVKPRKRDGNFFPYLKYEMKDGLTFIYQYRRISIESKVRDVIEYIVRDYKALCKMLLVSNEKPL